MGLIDPSLCSRTSINISFILFFLHITCLLAQLCSQEQSTTLLQFKHRFSFDVSASSHYRVCNNTYPKMESWKEGSDCCSWDGVHCDRQTGQVTGLHLNCSGLQGQIPFSTIFNNLTWLDLSFNNITGKFPNLLPNCPKLQYLSLRFNNFFGKFPISLCNCSDLEYLDLTFNNFFGLIPFEIGRMSNLHYISLGENNFSGNIPVAVSNLSSLEALCLFGNSLQGPIPQALFQLDNLRIMYMSYNQLSGQIPTPITVGNMINLDVGNNNLSGELPSVLWTLPKLELLLLNDNFFLGKIPVEITNSLKILDLSNNSFRGDIPKCLGSSRGNLAVLNLRNNNFSGSIPNGFARKCCLETINLYGNALVGSIPESLANCAKLVVLNLGYNKLSGKFPHWLENLPMLRVLILRSNNFHGHMSTTTKVKFPFPSLRVLDLSFNNFTGLLPERYFENFMAMMNVEEANYTRSYSYHNGTYCEDSLAIEMKGSYREIERVLTILIVIDLSYNKFEGKIPEIIGRLDSIRGLSLAHNLLTSHIPSTLGNLTKLESLDLSSNKLTGMIPQELTNLIFLSYLNLSYNQLTGPIPQEKQFGTFSSDSYLGNLALCGAPLSSSCNPKAPQPSHSIFQLVEDSQSIFDWEVILPGYGCGLILGLVWGYLMFSTGKLQWLLNLIERQRSKNIWRIRKLGRGPRGRSTQ